ncbi:MarR family transcriptional regulator [Kineosporia sp. J2-2]|uniref:MarR family transcriptional regulator n=1 Tax=Kineosporia corallincola TaxID=2835133 RepID=A0ABS5TEL2_9ACTN|nr:MarR family transcriptional regulator [Kineosporia corallincola]MBT0768656.1 MarR family transcriptional regulator [Kineosporia corallincola]
MTDDRADRDTLFRPGRRSDVLLLFRAYADAHVEASRDLARSMGINVSDAVAVAEILWGETTGTPLSPARLAERVGLTTGTTATMINRLEAAGYVVRSREDSDRRIIRLRLTEQARSRTENFFRPIGEAADRVLDTYDDTFLDQLEGVMRDMVAATRTRGDH